MSNGATSKALQIDFQRYLREGRFFSSEDDLLPLTLALYRRLGKGDPVTHSDLARDLELTSGAVKALVSEFPQSMIDTDKNDGIAALRGLSQIPANHLFVVDERRLHTWCVFDALFLPQILSSPAVCETICPTTHQRIIIELTPTDARSIHPAQPVMSIVSPSRQACCDNLRGAFCNHVNFFVDEEAYDQWAAGRTDVTCVSLEEAQKLANLWNQSRYGDKLYAA